MTPIYAKEADIQLGVHSGIHGPIKSSIHLN